VHYLQYAVWLLPELALAGLGRTRRRKQKGGGGREEGIWERIGGKRRKGRKELERK